jgi:hypothetical protein
MLDTQEKVSDDYLYPTGCDLDDEERCGWCQSYALGGSVGAFDTNQHVGEGCDGLSCLNTL